MLSVADGGFLKGAARMTNRIKAFKLLNSNENIYFGWLSDMVHGTYHPTHYELPGWKQAIRDQVAKASTLRVQARTAGFQLP
jgi:hypothetical protein